MTNEKLRYLINYLLTERSDLDKVKIPDSEEECFKLYRTLVNIRPAVKADDQFLKTEDEFLKTEIARKGITDVADLKSIQSGIYLWKGDITTLRCGAIVNAAKGGLTTASKLAYQLPKM